MTGKELYGPGFDCRRTRQHVDRLENHYLQTGEGWQNTVVPNRNLCEVRPEVSRHVAAENVENDGSECDLEC
jgi:hypothetical protein